MKEMKETKETRPIKASFIIRGLLPIFFVLTMLCVSACGHSVATGENAERPLKSDLKKEEKRNVLPQDEDDMKRATQAYEEGRYKDAMRLLDEIINRNPYYGRAVASKGYVMALAGDPAGGLPYVKKGDQLSPDDATIEYQMALVYKMGGHLKEALQYFQKVLQKEPSHTWSLYGVATIYADTGHKDEAFDYLGKAVATDKSVKEVACEQDHWASYKKDPRFIEITK